jgi:hypothetical protein
MSENKGIKSEDVWEAYRQCGSIRGTARALGIHKSTAKHHIDKMGKPQAQQAQTAPQGKESFSIEQSDTAQTITSVSNTVRTLEDALGAANVDQLVWEVERHTINKWDMARGNQADKWDAIELWQVKVWLRRRKQSVFVDPLQSLIDGIRKIAPKQVSVKRKSSGEPHLLVLGLFDAHFGKLAWAAETGNAYDLKIAESVFANAFHDLVHSVSGYNIESIVIPIGQDFFHTDNPQNATVNGTPQDVDGRRAKMFDVGVRSMIHCIDSALNTAPVQVFYSPGNHDRETSWYLTRVLDAYYHHNKDVQVDAAPTTRKYIEYGSTLLGFDHGDTIKPDKLPNLMAAEQREAWGRVLYTEWLTGHYHKVKEQQFTSADTHGGTVVRTLPSLSGTDSWHYRNGFVHGRRAAEAYLYSRENGYVGHFNANVRND